MNNHRATACFVMAALCALAFVAVGCTIDKLIRVDVPDEIQGALPDVGPKVTLREAPHTREQFALKAKHALESFDGNIEDAQILKEMFSIGAQFGMDQAGMAASTLPGGSLIVGALTTLGAFFVKRPGDKKPGEVAKEKEKSYAKGAEDAERKLRDQLLSLGVKLGERAASRTVDNIVDRVTGEAKP